MSSDSTSGFTLQIRNTRYNQEQAADRTIQAWICNAGETVQFDQQEKRDVVPVCLPGSAKHLISVGSIDKNGQPAVFSRLPMHINGVNKPDVYAPGTDILASVPYKLSPIPRRHTARISGTSISTAIVSGYVARILQKQPTLNSITIKPILATCDAIITTEEVLRTKRNQPFDAHSYMKLRIHPQDFLLSDNEARKTGS